MKATPGPLEWHPKAQDTEPVTVPGGPNLNLVPGAGVLGFGFDVSAASDPSKVTQRIVSIDESGGTTVSEGGIDYLLPANVNLIDIHRSDINFNMFASRAEFSEYRAGEAQVKASAWGFSSEFDASFSSLKQGEDASYYGLVEANTRFWNVTVEHLQALSLDPTFEMELSALPRTFDPTTQGAFFEFFIKYGTHVVSTAMVGGLLRYTVTVSSSSRFDKKTAHANMSLEYKSVFVDTSGSASADWNRMDSSWVSSRTAKLEVTGGTPDVLDGAVPPIDPNQPVNYNDLVAKWSASVVATPALTGLVLQPLSHIAPAAQVAALDAALDKYLNATVRGYSRTLVTGGVGPVGISNACTISVGNDVEPPKKRTKDLQPSYWIVMADEGGVVVFNENSLSNDPHDLDSLVASAETASSGQTWWTAVVFSATTNPPSQTALTWMASCGVPVSQSSWSGYPNWPDQVVALGMSNSSGFMGKLNANLGPPPDPLSLSPWAKTVESELPLYAAKVT
jgi:hypothetical protein